jgi:hypothetical protein
MDIAGAKLVGFRYLYCPVTCDVIVQCSDIFSTQLTTKSLIVWHTKFDMVYVWVYCLYIHLIAWWFHKPLIYEHILNDQKTAN